jgi:hypothetical protein
MTVYELKAPGRLTYRFAASIERKNTPHEQTSGMSTKRRRRSPDSSSPLLCAA